MSKHAHKQKRDLDSKAELMNLLEQKEAAKEATQELLETIAHNNFTPVQEIRKPQVSEEPIMPAAWQIKQKESASAPKQETAAEDEMNSSNICVAAMENMSQLMMLQQQFVIGMMTSWTGILGGLTASGLADRSQAGEV